MIDLRRLRPGVAIASLLVFMTSMFLPAIHAGGIVIQGSQLLWMGWMGMLYSGIVAWLANPLYVLALLLMILRKDRGAFWLGLAAFLIGLDSLRLDTWRVDEKPVPIDHLGTSFYLWEASFLILAIGAFVAWRRSSNDRGGRAAA